MKYQVICDYCGFKEVIGPETASELESCYKCGDKNIHLKKGAGTIDTYAGSPPFAEKPEAAKAPEVSVPAGEPYTDLASWTYDDMLEYDPY